MKKLIVCMLLITLTIGVKAQDYPQKFNNIAGWSIEGEKQFYSRDNLYDYINGASDFYLGYAFQDLWVVDYKNSAGQMLTLELYRHGSALQAFGIYTEERPKSAKLEPIGAQGFVESGAVFFLADDYYVKVYNSRPEVPETDFVDFAKLVAGSICESCGLPEQFTWFPKEGKVKLSEQYLAENFMGLTGFNGVSASAYELNGETFRLFVLLDDDDKCRSIMESYFKRLKYKKKLKEKTYSFDDPYLGKVLIAYKAGKITGLIDAKAPEQHEELLLKLHNK
ncbi:DUF6599 family protein [Carboxylicivirga sp. M1479]|uniref:DUF6599 family protein n=1 Tax=Carboxylicivirga sp. M1479 TaxID=2594476 RepID=UPI0011776AF1|nr:DUF6599 family protein [Carboxylicivirga sp. M1479]TRX61915.1 hypothetical protein FNN09_20115 [Carboxylicivirga sp. M1479]